MPIDPVTGTNQTQQSTGSTTNTTGFAADSNTFMKLLIANLQNQDPMAPQDSSSYMQQISQMTMVEQITKLNQASQETVAAGRVNSAIALLGHTVSYLDTDDQMQTGVVEHVDVAGGTPTLTVAGVADIDPATVARVS